MSIWMPYPGNIEKMEKGRLFLIPTPLSETQSPVNAFDFSWVDQLQVFVVEDLRTARRYLKKSGYRGSLDELVFIEFNEHSGPEEAGVFLESIRQGKSVGLMSEAGLPCVADPGAAIVRIAHQHHIKVVPLPGSSSIFLTLMASGANGQQFVFHGYLPIEKGARERSIREMEHQARTRGISQIFMETPYRNRQLLEAVLKQCTPDTLLCIGLDLLSDRQEVLTRKVADWRMVQSEFLHKRPAVFILFY